MSDSATAVVEADAVYAFEAVGFVDTRRMFTQLDSRQLPDNDVMWAAAKDALEPLGFAGIDDIHLSEDDGQGSRDIKVFVVIRLKGRAGLRKEVKGIPTALQIGLNRLAEFVCYSKDGQHDRVGAENWELTDWED